MRVYWTEVSFRTKFIDNDVWLLGFIDLIWHYSNRNYDMIKATIELCFSMIFL